MTNKNVKGKSSKVQVEFSTEMNFYSILSILILFYFFHLYNDISRRYNKLAKLSIIRKSNYVWNDVVHRYR